LYLAEAFVGPIVDLDAYPAATGRGDVNLWVDEWRVLARCQRGTAQIQLSWNVRPQQNLCVVQGTRGVIRVDVFGMSVTVRRQRGLPEHASRIINATAEGFGIAAQAAFNVVRVAGKRLWQFHGVQALIADFYARLREGAEPPVTPVEARRVLYWTEHVARQADAIKESWLAEATARRVGATTLVTGGGGFIGRQLVERLLQEGRKVRLFLRRPPAHELSVHPNVEIVLGDLGDAAVVQRAVAGVDTVFHIGAAMRGSGPEFERSTVTGTRNIVNSCLESGVRQLVYMSSLAVIDTDAGQRGEPVTEASPLEQRPEERGAYTRTKLEAERIVLEAVRDRQLPAVLFRPGEVVGPEKPLLTPGVAQRAGRTLVVIGDGRVRLPLVHVSDVVDALMTAADRGITDGTIIQLVEDVAITQNDIIEHYLATTGENRRVIRLPLSAVLAMARVMEILTTKVFGRALIGPRRIRAATASRRFDVSRAQTVLDWKPRVGVASSMARNGVDRGVGSRVAESEAGRAASV
jgi:nucleoside-diphosphate-sugar epimerase